MRLKTIYCTYQNLAIMKFEWLIGSIILANIFTTRSFITLYYFIIFTSSKFIDLIDFYQLGDISIT